MNYSRARSLLALVLCATGVSLAFVSFAAKPTVRLLPGAKIAPWVVEQTTNGQSAEFLVVLAEQADLSGADQFAGKKEKGKFVRDALWQTAEATQAPLRQWLRAHHVEHRAFYIVNLVWVKGDYEVAQLLAERSDVMRIEGNPQIHNVMEPAPNEQSAARTDAVSSVEQGIAYVHAPEVRELGYTGQGIVIGGADTGYRWDHTALKDKYRGWNGLVADHDFNWHDSIRGDGGFCGPSSPEPCDDNGHGSHTMGTAVGDDGGANQIGMAPGAKWIGCRNMDQGDGTPARYLECMEFFLAPYPVAGTPAQGDPSKAPDLTTNSWTCPPSEGCSAETLHMAVLAQRAAGIMMITAAGNDGPSCSTVQYPPPIYDEVYSVGALTNGTDSIASFSSRGPVTADGSSRPKPDLTAPGTLVRSVSRATTTAYTHLSGTSMAAPHVAGAVALLWSAQPNLRHDIARTELLLNLTAHSILESECTSPQAVSPNNVYGFGRLDIRATVAGALLRITTVASANTDIVTTFPGVAGVTYRLERKLQIDNADFESIAGLPDLTPSVSGPAQIVDPGGRTLGHAFYRVRLIP